MKTEIGLNTLKIFLFLGIVFFVAGWVMVFYFNKTYAIGIMSLGIIWAFISFGGIMRLKKK
jgi:hypothetical protein